MFSSTFVRLFVCLFVEPIFIRFGEKVAHGSRKKRLDFGCKPDLNPDPKIFLKKFTSAYWDVNAPNRGFGNRPKIRRLADLKVEQIKRCLGGGLRSPTASILVFNFNLQIFPNCFSTDSSQAGF